ncbi:DUF4238 domain-containing protein [Tritonibacter scottomollicae]|uniref:Uncharacterized protein DUF4238 n=1 Tax=Tritonibacter scottomollicae TaxID=483013 RepID=A0A2T1ABN1_TRISK|nr:DUF4238 domain-containing protein [Tritonibacter scottomollicae]PRZ46001.1 uncharacterized protein DUF4238 [Tritonibacter scottomollicae]
MAEKKNQHFVPKVHLRYFARDDKGRQIDVWLPKQDKVVKGASIKNQCSKSYFYGKDLKIENFLNSPEAMFGRTVDQLIECESGDDEALEALLFLWLLQHTRAERTITEQLLVMSAMRDKVSLGQEDNEDLRDWLGPPIGAPEAMQMTLDSAKEYFDIISDLRCVLLTNQTKTEFVLSDCPAVSSNKLILKRYMKYRNWGLGGAGLYLYMPLTPKLGFFAFDRHAYELVSRRGSTCNLNEQDVVALNQLVYLFCNDLVVLPPNCDTNSAISQLKEVEEAKPERTMRVNIATEDEDQAREGSKRFSVASDEEFAISPRGGLIHVESVPPIVPRHFPKLRIRQNPKFIDTQSAAGLKRYRA